MPVILDANADTVAGIAKFVGTLVGTIFLVLVKPWLEKRKERKMLDSLSSKPARDGGTVDDEPTGRHRVPDPDTAIERKWRERTERQAEQLTALRESLHFARTRIAELEAQLKTQDQIDADLERMRGAIAQAQREADERVQRILDQDVAPLRSYVAELEERLRAATSGHSRPVSEAPPDLRTDTIKTPVSGLHNALPPLRLPVAGRAPVDPDADTPRPRGLPERPRKP